MDGARPIAVGHLSDLDYVKCFTYCITVKSILCMIIKTDVFDIIYRKFENGTTVWQKQHHSDFGYFHCNIHICIITWNNPKYYHLEKKSTYV